jgi:hypothetical protein
MTKLKHTPGSWFIEKDNNETKIKCGIWSEVPFKPAMNVCIASVNSYIEEAEANACLISAAPEMLEAFINDFDLMFKIWDEGCKEEYYNEIESRLNKMQDIIEKATGLTIEVVLNERI